MSAKELSDWATKKLEDVCSQITDGKHGDCQDEPDSGFYFLSCKDVANGKLNYAGARQITEADFHDTHRRTKLEPSDILITNSGTIGRMAVAPDNDLTCRTTFQKSVAILKPIASRVDPSFLYYGIQADIRRLTEFGSGTAQKNLLLRDLRSFEIKVPPFLIQLRIAGILSAYDELIENSQRRSKILESMARALYREWFVHFRFPGHESVPRVPSPLGEIPQGWEVRKLKDVCRLTMGQSPRSEFYNEAGNGIAFHQGVTDFGDRFPSDRLFCTAEGRIAEAGDILFSVRASVGRMNIANKQIMLGRGLSAIRHNQDYQAFLWEQLRNRFTKVDMMGNGAIFASVTKDDMKGIELVCPPTSVIKAATSHFEPLHAELATLSQQIQNLRRTRDLLLPRLLSGQITVETLPGLSAEELDSYLN
jgi:type I restriction enzyme S subunit